MNETSKELKPQSFFDDEKAVFRLVAAVSVFVFVLVLLLNRKIFPRPEVIPDFVKFLPPLNAFINGTCFILLLISFYFIKQKRIDIHKKINLTTFFLSSLFIITYVTYHYLADETRYPEGNSLRTLYLFILASHIIFAATVLPLVLLSFYYGLKMDVKKHKRIVRFAFPIWLYVTLTGVIVYFMIAPFYRFN